MKILIVGAPAHFDECREKFTGKELMHAGSHDEAERFLSGSDVVFDFLIDTKPASFSIYASTSLTIFANTCMISLAELTGKRQSFECTAIGFNGFPTLFNRKCLEVAVLDPQDIPQLEKICNALQTEFELVDDRVGLVTPRVICMIINEAYFTVQEGTASRQDIDLAMRLGTNYPHGPFEWCKKIGLKNVYELLQAVYEDTRDERYKISALMKKEYLRVAFKEQRIKKRGS